METKLGLNYRNSLSLRVLLTVSLWGLWLPLHAQENLLDDRWFTLATPNFTFYSQVSSRQTRRIAGELETWRQIAAVNIGAESHFPAANVDNIVFLFKNNKSFSFFTSAEEPAFFYPTPRTNFMAFVPSVDSSQSVALHQYAHFLEKNFADLRVPRWYEEGLAGYLARIEVDRDRAEFSKISGVSNEILAQVNDVLPMDRLIYQDDALASPRLIQIANLKSEALLYYLLHAHEEGDFPDRRSELKDYLELLLEGRNPRFAFDQSFSVTTAQLDEELKEYLLNTSGAEGSVRMGQVSLVGDVEPGRVKLTELALALGELSLNTGKMDAAETFFSSLLDEEKIPARAYSGLGDALRFQELEGRDQDIARYFELALAQAPDQLSTILDYSEYWESELENCDKTYPAGQRQAIVKAMKEQLDRAIRLAPDSAEANLAMAEFYLLQGQDWRLGKTYQSKAFELLPADGFIMEQTIKYAVAENDFDEAERLIAEMAQPLHYFGEPGYVTDLRERLLKKRRGEVYDVCAE